ncbi:PDZ domain-containing protein [Geomonas sp. Red69]|uniref:PDZ domain-containing protein n=1 Tax=Geomonas diazotrophica TaxID=2843197 RepID=A0ABX8JHS1_9BACT|nr:MULTISPECIES: PDZ domain-containing protein [Geomonas]MBU5638290.1 PDZ domain-containing protein [Geomonas diazotrophica]QWV96706.1 PDZ domain-containing protein [Geomonas nitrogeniifigens]QXE85809.1 PDZ domain-containing protein [Geomonas nitrogeniifigens]
MIKTLCAILLFALLLLPARSQAAAVFGGVGIDGVPRADGTIVVRQLVAGGPAHLAGIKAGDIITQVDGTPTAGSDFKFIVERRLRGRAGTSVLVLVHRPGNPKTLSFKLVRRQLKVAGPAKKEAKGE